MKYEVPDDMHQWAKARIAHQSPSSTAATALAATGGDKSKAVDWISRNLTIPPITEAELDYMEEHFDPELICSCCVILESSWTYCPGCGKQIPEEPDLREMGLQAAKAAMAEFHEASIKAVMA
ncbi:hypothetical protein EON81_09975 [bacterium]|nr:MAG: hypothetical protein EON81_09975 [bacterium]